jgi:hypothetical protein
MMKKSYGRLLGYDIACGRNLLRLMKEKYGNQAKT